MRAGRSASEHPLHVKEGGIQLNVERASPMRADLSASEDAPLPVKPIVVGSEREVLPGALSVALSTLRVDNGPPPRGDAKSS